MKTSLADSSCAAGKIAKERVFVQIGILTVILKGERLRQTIVNKAECHEARQTPLLYVLDLTASILIILNLLTNRNIALIYSVTICEQKKNKALCMVRELPI